MLDEIVRSVRRGIPDLLRQREALEAAAARADRPRPFARALVGGELRVVAEVKRRSPSRGTLRTDVDPVVHATAYEAGGAAAISVLTEPRYFSGTPDDLRAVRAAVAAPVLRKDFVVEQVQVVASRAMGADAVLLIVAALDDAALVGLLAEARRWGMAALVEVHDAEEARRAVAADARVIGVNNRDLSTFEVDLATAERLRPLLDGVAVTVAESGVRTSADAARMADAGYDAVLVGEALMRTADPKAAVESLAVTRVQR